MSSSSTVVDYASGGRLSTEEMSSGQRCMSDDSLVELRSCGQIENGTPSTSPPYWDTDDDDDGGPKPSALYGKFTWKIEKFSQINKRELRSNAFEVGGYKWYILIYPQGCDVCNHLSLFLCVANHDKLLPGWSHFAQFTIAVVNKDPKKSKYSDTLHRFWKKEHDWGWKKFIELSKVLEGFINDDSLVIKAQVQVIREKAYRPFRCLDCQYRRELVRVYLSNVEQICRRFIEDRKVKFSKLIEDKLRWSSFRAFWSGIDQITRRRMSRDKTDTILRAIVKNFFVEKEVTSTLVMDSLYSGLKALECQSKNKKGKIKVVEVEDLPPSIVHIESDMFVLADDIMLLLERVALGPVPLQPLTPKDEKGSQNRTKDGNAGEEFNKDSIERDERRLTEFGRRTLDFFALSHIFSRIEVAHQEAVALKRQEELIREEEAAELAENELKAKRGAADKEKRTKKKQAKQRRNSRKVKDRAKDEKPDITIHDKHREQSPSDESIVEEYSLKQEVGAPGNASDTSDTVDDVAETIQPDLDKDCNLANWDTDASELAPTPEFVIRNGQTERRAPSVVDDSSSTCSTDSIPSIVMNGSYKGISFQKSRSQTLPKRIKNQRVKDIKSLSPDASHSASSMITRPEKEPAVSLNDSRQSVQQCLFEKDEVPLRQKEVNVRDNTDFEQPFNSRTSDTVLARATQTVKPPYVPLQQQRESTENAIASTTRTNSITAEAVHSKEPCSSDSVPSTVPVRQASRSSQAASSKSEADKQGSPSKSATAQQAASMSRPSSAPLIPAQAPTVSIVSTAKTPPPLLSRSVSAAGRLGTDPSPSAPTFVPQSYRSAIIGKNDVAAIPFGFPRPPLTSVSQVSAMKDQASVRPGLTFGSMKPEALPSQSQYQPRDDCRHPEPSGSSFYCSDLVAGIKRMEVHRESQARKQYSNAGPSTVGMVADEFPHLDIINDLLDEDRNIAMAAASLNYGHPHQHYDYQNHRHLFSQQYSFPGNAGSFGGLAHIDETERYYNDVGFMGAYGSSGTGPVHGFRDGRVDFSPFNGQIQGAIQNEWPYGAADLSMLSSANVQLPDYRNGMNGYMYARPGNGR